MDSIKWYMTDMKCNDGLKLYLCLTDGIINKEIVDIKSANKVKHLIVSCVSGVDTVLSIEDFDADANTVSNKFKTAFEQTSRSKFLDTWHTLKGRSPIQKSDSLAEETSSVAEDSDSIRQDPPHDIDNANSENVQSLYLTRREAIEGKAAGYFEVLTSDLKEPSWQRLHREANDDHVKRLMAVFEKHPHGYYQPIIVNIPNVDSVAQLKDDELDHYNLEVIGGNHSRIAYQRLLDRSIHISIFKKRVVKIYCGLTNEQARLVGLETNSVHQVNLKDGYNDIIFGMRAMLYSEAGMSNKKSIDEEPTPSDPSLIQRWKSKLVTATGSESRKQLNNSHRWTLILAQSPVEFWQVFCQFLDLFKKGNISGQTKPGKITRRSMAFLDPGSRIINLNKLTGALTDAVNLKSSLDTLEKKCLELLGKRKQTAQKRKENVVTIGDDHIEMEIDDNVSKDTGETVKTVHHGTCKSCQTLVSSQNKKIDAEVQTCPIHVVTLEETEALRTCRKELQKKEQDILSLKKRIVELETYSSLGKTSNKGKREGEKESGDDEKERSTKRNKRDNPRAGDIVVLGWSADQSYLGKVMQNGKVMSCKMAIQTANRKGKGEIIPNDLLTFNRTDVNKPDWDYLQHILPSDMVTTNEEQIIIRDEKQFSGFLKTFDELRS